MLEHSGDIFSLSLEELLNVKITVASLQSSTELHAGSTVSVVTRRDWQATSARRTLSAIDHLPATMVLPFAYGTEVIAIRGYAQTTSARGIASSLDGINLNNFAFGSGQYDTTNINLGVLDRIEMIRGPTSAIHGSDAFHGVLSLHSFESEKDSHELSAEADAAGYYQLGIRSSNGFNDKLRLNLTLATSDEQDQQRRYHYTDPIAVQRSIEKAQEYSSTTASINLAAEMESGWQLRWGLVADNFDASTYPGSFAIYDTGQQASSLLSHFTLSRPLANELELQTRVHYRKSDVTREAITPPGAFFLSSSTEFNEQHSGVDVQLSKSRREGGRNQWALSVEYKAQTLDDVFSTSQDLPADAPPLSLLGKQRSRKIDSLVYDGKSHLSKEKRAMQYGLRVDDYSDFGTQASPRLGLIYAVNTQSAVKLLYSHAFRAPTAFEMYSQRYGEIGTQGNPDLQPELMDALELVYMQQGDTWKGNIAIFNNRWHDSIRIKYEDGVSTYLNIGSSKAWGAEMSLSWLPLPYRVDFNIAYTRSRDDVSGNEYSAFPRWLSNLGLGYEWPAHKLDVYLISRAFSGVDETALYFVDNSEQLPFYLRSDLTLNYNISNTLRLSASIINLFDKDNHLPSVTGLENGIPDFPLTASLGMHFRF